MRARDNPFSTDRILKIRYRPQATTWEALLDRLAELNLRAAVTGLHGAGKTTLLEDLAEKLPDLGFRPRFITLNASSTRREKHALLNSIKSLGPWDILILDGAEQLGLLQWLRVRWSARHAGGVLISVHRPSRLPVLWHCTTSPQLLLSITCELAPGFAERDFQALFQKHHGNLREALRALYDESAKLEHPSASERHAFPGLRAENLLHAQQNQLHDHADRV